ncbi:MAG: ATP-binding cassette domain-containing protein, partial [Actinomycetota bacterium]
MTAEPLATATGSEPPTGTDGPDLAASGVDAGYAAAQILHAVDLSAQAGRITSLIGPNGSGKSTLLKVCTNLLDHQAGSVVVRGDDIAGLSTRQ